MELAFAVGFRADHAIGRDVEEVGRIFKLGEPSDIDQPTAIELAHDDKLSIVEAVV